MRVARTNSVCRDQFPCIFGERAATLILYTLRELLQRYADEQWVAAHMTTEQAAESVLDTFKSAVWQELELLELEAGDGPERATR